MAASGSKKVIFAVLAGNFPIALTKFTDLVMTGSSAMPPGKIQGAGLSPGATPQPSAAGIKRLYKFQIHFSHPNTGAP